MTQLSILWLTVVVVGCSSKKGDDAALKTVPPGVPQPEIIQLGKPSKIDYSKQVTPFDFSTEYKAQLKSIGHIVHQSRFGAMPFEMPKQFTGEQFFNSTLKGSSDFVPESEHELPLLIANNFSSSSKWDQHLSRLPHCPQPFAIRLKIENDPVAVDAPHLEKQDQLRGIELNASRQAAFDAFYALKPTQELVTLQLSGYKMEYPNKVIPELLQHFPKLRVLSLKSIEGISPATIAAISKLTDLEMLTIALPKDVTSQHIQQLAQCKKLRYLNLAYQLVKTKDLDASPLAQLEHLEYLGLGNIPVSNKLALQLAKLTKLEYLSSNSSDDRKDPLKDNGIAVLCSIPTLEGLIVRDCSKLTDAGYESIFNHTAFRMLWLEGVSGLTGERFKTIGQLDQLTDLRLTVEDFTKSGKDAGTNAEYWTGMAKLSQLQYLRIATTALTDEIVKQFVPNLKELERLMIFAGGYDPNEFNDLTDKSLIVIAKLPKLQELTIYIRDPLKITDKGFLPIVENPSIKKVEILGWNKPTAISRPLAEQFYGQPFLSMKSDEFRKEALRLNRE